MSLLNLGSEGPARALVVEDDNAVRRDVIKLLDRNGCRCVPASAAEEARALLETDEFDIVLTNIDLPGGSGLDLLMHISSQYKDVAAIVVTQVNDAKVARAAMDAGAYSYVIKPFDDNEMLIAVSGALMRRKVENDNRNQMMRLEQMVSKRNDEMWAYVGELEKTQRDMRLLQDETIRRLSLAAEFRDDETPRHIERMSRYCALIADRIGFDSDRCELIQTASALHDVGKIGVPDEILLKPGSLDPEEWAIMQRHCEIGHRILTGSNAPVLVLAAEIALSHHERMDGSGYPRRLKGEEIPIEARIAAIADVFDALTSDKVYREAFSFDKAIEIMMDGRGTHFDPQLLDAFLSEKSVVLGIKDRFSDLDQKEAELNPLSALAADL